MRIAPGILIVASLATPLRAAVLLDEDIDRPTRHSQQWVPSTMYAAYSFVADGADATIEFSAQTHSTETQAWLRQSVDNIAVLPKSVYDQHLLSLQQADLGNYFWLQIEPSYPVTFFDHTTVAPADFVLFDRCDTAPNAGWDLTQGAYFFDSNVSFDVPSAPTTDLLNPTFTDGGSLGLGTQNSSPGTAITSIHIQGLTPGTEYALAFWWLANNDNIDENGNPIPNGDLFVRVLGSDVLAVEQTSWSGIKQLFRP
jgi:hypothetical protein